MPPEAHELRQTAAREAQQVRATAQREVEEMRAAAEVRVRELDRNAEAIWRERRRLIEDMSAVAQQQLEIAEAAAARFPRAEAAAEESAPAGEPVAEEELSARTSRPRRGARPRSSALPYTREPGGLPAARLAAAPDTEQRVSKPWFELRVGCGGVKIAYIFSTSGHTASYKLGKMILPQLEQGSHGVEVVGMFFFDDNTYVLRAGDPLGERLGKLSEEQGIMLMLCDRCALERSLAEGEPGDCRPKGTVAGVQVGCFPDLYRALSGNPPDQVITL